MGKLITSKAIQILVLQALIAILLAVCNGRASQAAPYTIFGFDNPRGSLTNSNAAAAAFQASVFDVDTDDLESYNVNDRNVLYDEGAVLLGTRVIQYGLEFAPGGGSSVFARSSQVTVTYAVLGISSTTPAFDDRIVDDSTTAGFNATPVSGDNFMGGESKNLRFDFFTTGEPGTGIESGVKAFGFYGIDAGDTALNNLSVDVFYDDATTQNFVINPGGFGSTANDNTFFFGVVSPDKAFTSVRINSPQSATDSVGYDNLMVGRNVTATVVPEIPSLTGLLLGSSLLGGLMMVRRRKDTI
ncbi:MAG: hypothetical protein H7Y38_01005 [Armatimonadetes bacterium]|nr:hypothetical protein [Armatimonadota bacterium]